MDPESRKNPEGIEKASRFPTGILTVERGECKIGALNPTTCMFCTYGHMLECHYPHTCEEVKCSHYFRDREIDE